jgi:hypothetical protein
MSRIIDLNRLPREQAQAILDRVIELDGRIFLHDSEQHRERFQAGMRDLDSSHKVVVLYEHEGELVGFNIIKIASVEVDGRTYGVVGSTAGLLPGHTGGNRTLMDGIRAMLRHKLAHPRREYYMVSFLINPGGYDMLVETCPDTFPSVHRPTSVGVERALISAAAGLWGMEVLSDSDGRVITRAGRRASEVYERRRETKSIRYFEAHNPGYASGELLGTCTPLDLRHLLVGALRLARRRCARRAQRLIGARTSRTR